MSEDYKEGQENVLLAITDFIANGGVLDATNWEAFAKTFDE
jgi:hypothetical protein